MDNYFPLNANRIEKAVEKTRVEIYGGQFLNSKFILDFDFGLLQNPEILTVEERLRFEKSREILEKFKKKEW